MQFIITAHDGENMLEKRMSVRPRHLEGMAKLGERVVCAGGSCRFGTQYEVEDEATFRQDMDGFLHQLIDEGILEKPAAGPTMPFRRSGPLWGMCAASLSGISGKTPRNWSGYGSFGSGICVPGVGHAHMSAPATSVWGG